MLNPFQTNPNALQYPSPQIMPPEYSGLFPVDFIIENILATGIDWFRTDPNAPELVFGQLNADWLKTYYGPNKIQEIADYIKKYEIQIIQHWALISQSVPCISIQLLDGNEDESKAAFSDFKHMADVQDEITQNTIGRTEWGYLPINDSIHIGIHAAETPDLVKYLYYLVAYVLGAFKDTLQNRGLQLTTFRATDISRLNEYLPENIFSRYINFSTFTIAPYKKSELPIAREIVGLNVGETTEAISETDNIKLEDGIFLNDTQSEE